MSKRTHWQQANEIREVEPSFVFTDNGRHVGYTYTRDGVEHRWQMRRASVFVNSPESREDWVRIAVELQRVFRLLGGLEYQARKRDERRAQAVPA